MHEISFLFCLFATTILISSPAAPAQQPGEFFRIGILSQALLSVPRPGSTHFANG